MGQSARELLQQIETFNRSEDHVNLDTALQAQLRTAATQLSRSLERPTDATSRILCSQLVENAAIRIALRLKLFTHIVEGKTNHDLLKNAVKVEPVLLGRILRCLVAFGALKEIGENDYAVSPSHSLLADEKFASAVATCAEFLNPVYNALPPLLADMDYDIPSDPHDTAVQRAYNAKGKSLIEILMERGDYAQGFGTLMAVWGEDAALLQSLYPVQHLIDGFKHEENAVMFVDVGGGMGQKTLALKKSFPDIPGRLIVQDTPQTISHAPTVDGIEFMAHDFFTEQPIKGARTYYIRQCLHNWRKAKVKPILENIRDAMTPGYSKLLVHELVVPERNPSVWHATQDFNMMGLCATQERPESHWRYILDWSGLKITKIYYSQDDVSESVIEAEVKTD